MTYLSPLFEPGTYLVKSKPGRSSIYKGRRILLARITFRQFKRAEDAGLLREKKRKDPTTGADIFELNRQAVRVYHRSNLKRLYLKWCKTGQMAAPVFTRTQPTEPIGGLFSDVSRPNPWEILEAMIVDRSPVPGFKITETLRSRLKQTFDLYLKTPANEITTAPLNS